MDYVRYVFDDAVLNLISTCISAAQETKRGGQARIYSKRLFSERWLRVQLDEGPFIFAHTKVADVPRRSYRRKLSKAEQLILTRVS